MLSLEKEIKLDLKEKINYIDASHLVVEIPTDFLQPITKVIVEFDSSKIRTIKSFTLKHAFNHVMSDLVLDKKVTDLDLRNEFSYQFETPKSASHILIDAVTDSPLQDLIKKIRIFVVADESVVTSDEREHIDSESISFGKKVESDYNNEFAYLVTDGSYKTTWQGDNYPANLDIDLEAVYSISKVSLYFPKGQQVIFDLYGSNDGLNYDFICGHKIEIKNDSGYDIPISGDKSFSFVRLTILYNSGSDSVKVKQVRVFGNFIERREPIKPFKFLLNTDFKENELSLKEAINGIISRQIGSKYLDWFEFKIDKTKENYFKLENDADRILITGETGVNIATGLNYYLKYYCKVNISQFGMGNQISMPSEVVTLDKTIEKKSTAKYVYSYNYTTFSYTMAFWGRKEWQNELDWLALNGVNLVLDPVGQEAVWGIFLRKLGYSDTEIQRQISFSTYSAWQWMGNISGVGGPVSLEWVNNRTKLAHENHDFMKVMGMNPIFRAYGGVLPGGIQSKRKNLDIIVQGQWCSFHRPDMLMTNSNDYCKMATLFYESQSEVLGNLTHFYSADPFHEGGIMGNVTAEEVSKNLMENLLKFDSQAIWVIQSWQENPTPGLLKGISEYKLQHALVLDLYAERVPQWIKADKKYHGGREFAQTPWIFCFLNNFGGRMGLSGNLSSLQNSYHRALNEGKFLQGIGITPEASLNNPIIYDYFFELIWQDKDKNLNIDSWLKEYALRRYGKSQSAFDSLKIQLETVYNSDFNNLGQGAPESVINARPDRHITSASTWGNTVIEYSKTDLVKALRMLLRDYSRLKNSSGYKVDLASLSMQVVSNFAQDILEKIDVNIDDNDLNNFNKNSQIFERLITLANDLSDQVPEFRLSTWVKQAQNVATNLDDFSKKQILIDARAIVSTWWSIKQANSGGLHDYSNRQWSGVTDSLYAMRWEKWFSEQRNLLLNKDIKKLESREWFILEWNWVLKKNKNEGDSRKVVPLNELVQETLEVINYE